MGRREGKAAEVAESLRRAGGEGVALPADVLEREALEGAKERLLETWNRCDILVNAAGGNMPGATVVG